MTAKLPDRIRKAPLPINYEDARAALAKCEKIDECKDWSDRAIALASYAKQIKDKTLFNSAKRIQDRAVRRTGQLLKKIAKAKTGPKLRAGIHPQSGRKAAMADPEGHAGKKVSIKIENLKAETVQTYISRARMVLRHAPDLAPQVRDGVMPLEHLFMAMGLVPPGGTNDAQPIACIYMHSFG